MSYLPQAKIEGVVVERVGDDEFVLYDEDTHAAHALSPVVATVWELCDGRHSPDAIASRSGIAPELVARALDELGTCGLLDEAQGIGSGYSRREAGTRIAKAGGVAFLAPLIYSVAIGPAAAAASTDLCAGVTCTPLDQCHMAGTCDPSTGQCSNPPAPNGTLCNDGNACTQNDTCQAGTCTGGNTVMCTAIDQCHDVGFCDPTTGECSNPAKPNGTACTGCGESECACQTGTCAPVP